MKINHTASPFGAILFLALSLTSCGVLGLPDLTKPDEVPEEIKAQPRLVSVPQPNEAAKWPRLGDVPSKPKDFPEPEAYEQSMDEMAAERMEAESLRASIEADAPQPPPPAVINNKAVVDDKTTPTLLIAPQFKKGN